ncbi:DUF421 domain-containing protein [Alteromonas ponticola]|uniref:DUF421 domain-containing protein n=1 Tax=Alteromonas aquimaris TaxID=2998417 RepID=A0ABT3P9W3_9ALTE|nr:YetF domain-containing protein [Alteromonas aquimaris]MCW8109567.1 DUF421 domain-containing protein [Alteromonas aquimaris]
MEKSVSILEVVTATSLAYFVVVLLILIVGKRASAKLNNFDWIVTVAMGALLGTTALNRSVSIWEGATAICCLFVLQYVFTFLSVHSRVFRKYTQHAPSVLALNGELIDSALVRHRVTPAEVRCAIRQRGYCDEKDVDAVVLEACGELSVIKADDHSVNIEKRLRRDCSE